MSVFGIWDIVFGIRDSVFGIWDTVKFKMVYLVFGKVDLILFVF